MSKEYQVTLHNGELAIRECNPYDNYEGTQDWAKIIADNKLRWYQKNADRPYYILTGEHGLKEGDVVTGDRVEIVWQQYHFYISGDWYDLQTKPEPVEDIHRLTCHLKEQKNTEQPIIVNCLHAVCPKCGNAVDVIPAYGTVIIKEQVKEISDCKYPHLTKLSDDYNKTQELNAEIDKFLSIDDGGYETPEQAFICGVYFGYRHTVTAANQHTIEVIEGRIKELRELATDSGFHHIYDRKREELEHLLTLLKQ